MVVIDGSGINYLLTDLIANFEKNCFSGDFSSWNKIFNWHNGPSWIPDFVSFVTEGSKYTHYIHTHPYTQEYWKTAFHVMYLE